MRRAQTPTERGVDQYDRRKLARAMEHAADGRTYRRVQAVLLVAHGYPVPEVARITASLPASIYAWVQRSLRKHRPDDLTDAARSGRPPGASAITDACLVREFHRDPLRLGYNWGRN